ncbi:unnamed protein product [Rhizoctonia solani]|uniref:Uncharacterized protein n=1 Tax=Rhizoctonia solani TaxID=456999 RepID=A0A8H2ZVI0_9AGAM|nr:unnamed protein product [Rhizoctonia solani]
MHFPAIATGFRLLAKCFTKSPILSSAADRIPTVPSTSSIIDVVVKSVGDVLKAVEAVEEVAAKPVETVSKSVGNQGANAIESNASPFQKDAVGSVSKRIESMRSWRVPLFEVPQSRTDSSEVQVECTPNGAVLQARIKKDLEFVAAKNPILRSITQIIERDEEDELMNKVLKLFEEVEEMEKFKLQLQVPIFDEDLGDEVQARADIVPLGTWIDAVKEAEIALDIARCEMTVEDVDDLLTRLYIDMNRLVAIHAKNTEDRKRMALEVSAKIKEYAEVLLESPCEIRLAVDRARLRSVVAKRFTPGDAEYLASLGPGSSHALGCDGGCISSYLPHRIGEKSEVGSEPELITSEGSRCSTPSEAPNTPRVSISELQGEPEIVAMAEEINPIYMKPVEVVRVKSKTIDRRATAKIGPVRKVTNIPGGGKPA